MLCILGCDVGCPSVPCNDSVNDNSSFTEFYTLYNVIFCSAERKWVIQSVYVKTANIVRVILSQSWDLWGQPDVFLFCGQNQISVPNYNDMIRPFVTFSNTDDCLCLHAHIADDKHIFINTGNLDAKCAHMFPDLAIECDFLFCTNSMRCVITLLRCATTWLLVA